MDLRGAQHHAQPRASATAADVASVTVHIYLECLVESARLCCALRVSERNLAHWLPAIAAADANHAAAFARARRALLFLKACGGGDGERGGRRCARVAVPPHGAAAQQRAWRAVRGRGHPV